MLPKLTVFEIATKVMVVISKSTVICEIEGIVLCECETLLELYIFQIQNFLILNRIN